MIFVFKKIICLLAVLLLVFCVTAFAQEEFLVYGEDNIDYFCNAFNMNAGDINDYIEQNNITYFAMNNDNTKQIKRIEFVDEFSQKAVDLSVLEDNEILKLSGDISGFSDAKGEVVNHAGFKFLKLRLETKDSGGDYILTEYITVNKAKKIILAFYTANGKDEGYIDKAFKEQFSPQTNYKPFLTVGIIIFVFIGLVAVAFIIKDFKQKD